MKKEYSVYILKCSDGSYYTGVTNDVQRRFSEHSLGLNPGSYTHTRRPVELVYSTTFEDVYEAIDWEKQLKKWSRKKKEAVINDKFELLPSLSKKDFSKRREVFDTRCSPLAETAADSCDVTDKNTERTALLQPSPFRLWLTGRLITVAVVMVKQK